MRESVDQDGPSLFGGLRLSTQAKRMEMRPRSASKEERSEELDQGKKCECVSKLQCNRNRLNRLTCFAERKLHGVFNKYSS